MRERRGERGVIESHEREQTKKKIKKSNNGLSFSKDHGYDVYNATKSQGQSPLVQGFAPVTKLSRDMRVHSIRKKQKTRPIKKQTELSECYHQKNSAFLIFYS